MPNAPYPLDFETQNLEDESKKLQEMLSFYENAKNEQEGAQAVTDALKAAFGSIGFEGASEPPPPERDDPEVSPEPEPASLDDAARAAAALEEAEAAEDPELRKLADETLKAQYELERETGAAGAALRPSEPLTESESFAASGAIASGPPPIPPKEWERRTAEDKARAALREALRVKRGDPEEGPPRRPPAPPGTEPPPLPDWFPDLSAHAPGANELRKASVAVPRDVARSRLGGVEIDMPRPSEDPRDASDVLRDALAKLELPVDEPGAGGAAEQAAEAAPAAPAAPAPAAPAAPASPAPSSWLARRRDAQRRELGLAGGPAAEAPAAPAASAPACDHCGAAGAKLRCSGCRSVVYCARACQASAWKAHRETCAGAARDRARRAKRAVADQARAKADAAAKLAEAEAAAETVAAALEEAEAAEAGVREERAAADAMARTVAAGLDAPEAAPKPSEMKQAVASTRAWAEGQRPKKPLTPAQRQKREELFLAAQKAKDMARGEGTSRPSRPKTRKPKSLSRDYEKWDGFDDFSDGDEAWQGTLPLASTYGKWDAYDGESSDDDAPARDAHGYDKLWCPVHNVSHYGECAKCVAARGGAYEPVLAPKAYVPRRDPKDVDAAMESMETKVKDHARAKDVLHQLKAKIDGIPDDEVSIRGCLEAIKIAGAYSPKDATIHKLLKPPDEQPPRPQGPLPEGK